MSHLVTKDAGAVGFDGSLLLVSLAMWVRPGKPPPSLQKMNDQSGKMALGLRAPAALPKDLSLIPSTNTVTHDCL